MLEILKCILFGELKLSSFVNLERVMVVNGCFGGYIVLGYIDGIGEVVEIKFVYNLMWYCIKVVFKLMCYIIEKGLIIIDGISFMVVDIDEILFCVLIILYIIVEINLGMKKIGSFVNLENDIVGKYIE